MTSNTITNTWKLCNEASIATDIGPMLYKAFIKAISSP